MSEWSHLPNAVHIDRILAHLETHPEKWTVIRSATYEAVRDAAWRAARNAARNVAYNAVRDVFRGAVGYAAQDATYTAASGAILALITNDACGHLLREKIEHVELLASLGTDEAILLLPAVRAMSRE
jgi:hypothetical protein